jgi:hypothetical protein
MNNYEGGEMAGKTSTQWTERERFKKRMRVIEDPGTKYSVSLPLGVWGMIPESSGRILLAHSGDLNRVYPIQPIQPYDKP